MPRHSPYALTYFSLHGLHKYCTRHAGYELDFMLPRILSYYSSAQSPKGAPRILYYPTCQRTPPVASSGGGYGRLRGVDPLPGPAQRVLRCRSSCLVTKLKKSPWSYRDSNPRSTASQQHRPCTTSLHQHSHNRPDASEPNYSVELQGFEPWTPALQRQCSSQLSYSPLSLKLQGARP